MRAKQAVQSKQMSERCEQTSKQKSVRLITLRVNFIVFLRNVRWRFCASAPCRDSRNWLVANLLLLLPKKMTLSLWLPKNLGVFWCFTAHLVFDGLSVHPSVRNISSLKGKKVFRSTFYRVSGLVFFWREEETTFLSQRGARHNNHRLCRSKYECEDAGSSSSIDIFLALSASTKPLF